MSALEAVVPSDRLPDSLASIELQELSVSFRVPHEQIWSFKEYAIKRLRGRIVFEEFVAVRGITLLIKPGETFGIVGKNGAGKSTLLKVIARVRRPTSGRVIVRGTVAPLLELGAGFHSDLTGRENVFLNATLLGHPRRDVLEHYDDIVNFSEIGGFIDAPIRTYSSGMVARLGFALATAWRPDILLVDETLAVGDEAFQTKCRDRIGKFRESGSTIVLVTHSLQLLRSVCSRAMWLDRGSVRLVDAPDTVASAYLAASAQP